MSVKKIVSLHLMSDLHLELCHNLSHIRELVGPIHNTSNKILILAGDIGDPKTKKYYNFLDSCSKIYKDVIFITGNHEYYNNTNKTPFTIEEIDNLIRSYKKSDSYDNIHFLNKNKITIDGVTFLGTTLWTKIDKKYEKNIQESITDFHTILMKSKNGKFNNFNINDWNNIHNDQLEWLKKSVEEASSDEKIVVITHHLPTQNLSHEKYKIYEKYNSAFYTDLSKSNIFNNKIKYWFCGHTHTKMSWTDPVSNINFHTNPLGYAGENNSFDILEINLEI